MAFSLAGKVALVTGGGRGIGAAIATRFAEAGAKVIVANRTVEHAENLADALSARGLDVAPLPLPGTSRGELTRLVDGIAEQYGRLDILVHNAGGCPGPALKSLTKKNSMPRSTSISRRRSGWCKPPFRT